MDKRMFGPDSEYTITCVFRGDRRLPLDEVARDVFRGMTSGADVLLRNGARLNLKVANHPEYATPECGSLPDMLIPFLVTRQLICGAGKVLQARRAPVTPSARVPGPGCGRSSTPAPPPEVYPPLTARGNLARWIGEAGDTAGARDQDAALIPLYERVLGAEHPHTLTIRANQSRWARLAQHSE